MRADASRAPRLRAIHRAAPPEGASCGKDLGRRRHLRGRDSEDRPPAAHRRGRHRARAAHDAGRMRIQRLLGDACAGRAGRPVQPHRHGSVRRLRSHEPGQGGHRLAHRRRRGRERLLLLLCGAWRRTHLHCPSRGRLPLSPGVVRPHRRRRHRLRLRLWPRDRGALGPLHRRLPRAALRGQDHLLHAGPASGQGACRPARPHLRPTPHPAPQQLRGAAVRRSHRGRGDDRLAWRVVDTGRPHGQHGLRDARQEGLLLRDGRCVRHRAQGAREAHR